MIDLVLKWSHRLGPDTIERHRDFAEKHGSVWWGRLSAAPAVGLGAEWVDMLRAQLKAGRRTYVYLHSKPGGTWRAHLHDITLDIDAVDSRLIPPYYDLADPYVLWVRLSRFVEFQPSSLTEKYVLARTGDPVTLNGLINQKPSILRRRGINS